MEIGNTLENHNNCELKYDGESLNVKEFMKIKILFEGEFIKGERNGEGKEYDSFDYLIHEGEFLHGNLGDINIFSKIFHLNNGDIFFGNLAQSTKIICLILS